MIATIILGIFSVLFSYLASYKKTQWGLKVSFILIFLFLALRYNFGNDYEIYFNNFMEIGQSGIDYYKNGRNFEFGWILLNWLFHPLGFFSMIATISCLNCLVFYQFFIKYVPPRYYWLATFLYIFNPNFMLVHSTAMRQSIAVMIFVYSLNYLCQKNVVRFFICLLLASFFHFSSIFLLPVYFLVFFNRELSKTLGVVFISVFVTLLFFHQSLSAYFTLIINHLPGKYELYQDAGATNTGLGFFLNFAFLILIVYYERFQKREIALIFKVAILGFLVMPLVLVIEMISRLGMYFAPATIIAYTNIAIITKYPAIKSFFITLLLSFTIYQFFQFFYSSTYNYYFFTYKTIFSAQQWY